MAFDEVRLEIGGVPNGTVFRRIRRTEIAERGNGFEERNAIWARSRLRADLSTVVRTADQQAEVIAFWEARLGRARGFRMKDKTDWKSSAPSAAISPTDQLIGTGDGAVTTFQLTKAYTSGGQTYLRTIAKPVAGTVQISLDDVPQGSGWTVDTTTGVVTFASAPGSGVAIKAGYEFDVPVRFDTDEIGLSILFDDGSFDDIPVVEILT